MSENEPKNLYIYCAKGHEVDISNLGFDLEKPEATEMFKLMLRAAIGEAVIVAERCAVSTGTDFSHRTCPADCGVNRLLKAFEEDPDRTFALIRELFLAQGLSGRPSHPQLPSGEDEG